VQLRYETVDIAFLRVIPYNNNAVQNTIQIHQTHPPLGIVAVVEADGVAEAVSVEVLVDVWDRVDVTVGVGDTVPVGVRLGDAAKLLLNDAEVVREAVPDTEGVGDAVAVSFDKLGLDEGEEDNEAEEDELGVELEDPVDDCEGVVVALADDESEATCVEPLCAQASSNAHVTIRRASAGVVRAGMSSDFKRSLVFFQVSAKEEKLTYYRSMALGQL
jgi:hypothetical protein